MQEKTKYKALILKVNACFPQKCNKADG